MKLVATESAEGDQTIGAQKAKQIIQAHPNIVGLVSVDAGGTVGIAQAVKELNKVGEIVTTGLSTPSQMRQFVKDGSVPRFVLWDPAETGYLTTVVAFQLVNGRAIRSGQRLKVSSRVVRSIPITRVKGTRALQAIQGPALVFDRRNIDRFKF
jgi:rhamnose transport system substrate-binding protein